MNKPLTISSLFFANALFCASLCVAQTETSQPVDTNPVPSPRQAAGGDCSDHHTAAGGLSDPEAGFGSSAQINQDVPTQPRILPTDPDVPAWPILHVQTQDEYLSAEITIRDEEAGFIAAVLVSTSESFMDIRGEAVLRGGKMFALGLGSGTSIAAPLPGALLDLRVEVYMQALIVDPDGTLHIGPITRLSEQLQNANQQTEV